MLDDFGTTKWQHWFRQLEYAGLANGTVYLVHAAAPAVRYINSQYADLLRIYWRAELPEAQAVHISQKQTQSPEADSVTSDSDLLFAPQDLPITASMPDSDETSEASDQDRPIFADADDTGGGFLDPRMTFANFIVGEANHLAAAAAQEIANKPTTYNPLFIHGGVGLGKTHLLQAIAWHARSTNTNAKKNIVYLSAERFMTRFLHALKSKTTSQFMQRLRSVDVLIVDDVQFICGKEKTQEEFLHTYNNLIGQHKQVILAADRPPLELPLGEKLQSRLNCGMVVKIHPCDARLRLAILNARMAWEKIELPDPIVNYLAQKITGNVRELEGALTRLSGQMRHTGKTPSIDQINVILADLLRAHTKRITIADIQRIIAEYYGVKSAELLSRRRTKDIVRPRHIAMYLGKNLTRCSYPEIGRRFGNRDHSTVMHAVRTIERLMKHDSEFADEVALLRGLVRKAE